MKYTFDSRAVKPGMGFVALKGEKSDGHDFIPQALAAGASRIIDGYAELDRAANEYRRTLKAKVIGVTGSAGKTTTKELVKAFLSKVGRVHATEGNFNNHIGLPMTILECPEDAEFLVLEMGTNHPGEIAHLCDIAEPDVGLITGIGTAHIEFFKTREGIASEKGTLFARCKSGGFGVVSAANDQLPILRELSKVPLVEVVPGGDWLVGALKDRLPGEHNLSNASLAFALCSRFGVTEADAVTALEDFALPGSRWRRIERGTNVFIDDTYNANPDSMIAALNAFAAIPCAGRHVAILGDMFELGEDSAQYHRQVFEHAMKLGIPLVIGVGEESSKCLCHLAYKELGELKRRLKYELLPGDVVLLKASHSMELGKLLD